MTTWRIKYRIDGKEKIYSIGPYDRGERFTQRVELFNWWGEQLAAAQRGAKIIPLPGKAEIAA